MAELGTVEDTLFVPMLGRIYASENCKNVLYDEKALSLKDKLPEHLAGQDTQTEYTLIASASRSANMDRYIRNFLKRRTDGAIVQLGCGLETTFFRDGNGRTMWYGIDLPDVIEYRRILLPESEHEKYIAGDAFSDEWIRQVRSEQPDAPLLVTASGLFYYFEEDKVLELFKMLQGYGYIEVVFDTVNKSGMTAIRKKWIKMVGHEDAKMFFYVDSAAELVAKIGGNAKVFAEEKYYNHIDRSGLKFGTRFNMWGSDLLNMVKMIHLAL
ncbi:class I SAM-dependent methyltransferase [Lachnoclostridium sp. Marseille-P6806]|uniref:class I SAM-dependent methyltransferase n=1 Tax=Lachnoclostridium sp. Marseille-P6806 TaxID=2364793 RepID=UPI00103161BC|nr:class I SAM-dependent methyltransferase [Lachnoclostridium sp. Marseille-P6806]